MDGKLNEVMKGFYDKLTDEQKEKAKACKSMDEMMALAGEWGIELSDEMVDTVAGGVGLGGCRTHCFGYDYYQDVQGVI